MSKEEVIEWIAELPLQTLTDELKEEIISMVDEIVEKDE